ncbi:peptidoglycan-binding protein [Nostoc punctiforme FACHB-252]|uniref:Peptidoglycan-binding protein n=1 Tax=Nostoc punctiforme FACHB-252 TaxID=1357509 RepID=A0ABR8HEG1_NOSPU|nr:peptidoglycan-binding protein [Nostoc punctiforme]MBD2614194.1 peptidoglycan-binding protein [Nostoc punctiforme FACHB-252]
MEVGVDGSLSELASAFEASESIKVVRLPVILKFLNWENLPSSAAMHLLSVALTMGILSVAGEVLALQKIGTNGSQVANSQRCLKKLGYFKGPVTGKFATLTENAVIKFQQANRLPAVGFIGPSTQRALQRACQSQASSRNVNGNSASAVNQYPTLSQGSTGAAVTKLQQRLQQRGYFNANPTGNFGRITKDAVIAFQRNAGISTTGIVDRQTWNALLGSSQAPAKSSFSTQQIRELQQGLRQLGYFKANPTGTSGPITREAITKFQQDYKLPVNGQANTQALVAVRRALAGGYATQQPARNYLTVGDRSDNVRLVQNRLWQLGFFNANADGYFSDYTRNSVMAFQQSFGLNSTGNVDWQTWEALGLNNAKSSNYTETNRYLVPVTNGYLSPEIHSNILAGNNGYKVIVPIFSNDTLSKVQQYIPHAVTEQSSLGDYVNAGAFSDRAEAERVTKMLRSYGVDARVKYN